MDLNFDTDGLYHLKDASGQFVNDPSQVTAPLLRDSRTLYDMLTDGGRDFTGFSSEVYIVVTGDDGDGGELNNGCFKVIGAGTAGYTEHSADDSYSLVLEPLSAEWGRGGAQFDLETSGVVTVEFRSQYTNAEDGNGLTAGNPALCIVLTDIFGLLKHPWQASVLSEEMAGDIPGLGIDNSLPEGGVASKMCLSTTLLSLIHI